MKKGTKIGLIIATVLTISGAILFTAAMAATGWDFQYLNNSNYETNQHEIIEEFQSIDIESSAAKIVIQPSETATAKVICYEDRKTSHSVSVQNGTLVIDERDTRDWFDFISIGNFQLPEVTVYLPQSEYASLSIETDFGDVEVPAGFTFGNISITSDTGYIACDATAIKLFELESNTGYIKTKGISAAEIDVSVDTGAINAENITCTGNISIKDHTGKTSLTNITCKNLSFDGSSGKIILKNVIATETFYLENNTGDIEFTDCDAAEIFAKTNTGNICGTLLSEKIFFAKSSTGHISVPQSMNGGKCELTTNTGDITIEIKKELPYEI